MLAAKKFVDGRRETKISREGSRSAEEENKERSRSNLRRNLS
jgi:hypothetical protein